MSSKNLMNKLPDELARMIYSYIYADAINEIKNMTYLDTCNKNNYSDECILNRYIKLECYMDDNFLNFCYGDTTEPDHKRENQECLGRFEADNKIKRQEIKMNKLRDGYLYMATFSWENGRLNLSKHKLNIERIKNWGMTVNEIYDDFTITRDKMLKNEVIENFTYKKPNKNGRCCNSICGFCD
jgi:hypothetical protein